MCKVINNFSDFVNGILSAKREKIAKINKRLNDGDLLYLYEKSRFVYRGQPNVNFELLPSIARGKSDPHEYGLLDEERSFIELCKFKRPDIFRKEMSSIELLALLQHYGMKTRLLDVTENP